IAAAPRESEPVGSDCPRKWSRHAAFDSSVSLCLPPGFVGHDAHSWRRPAKVTGRGPSDFLSVEMLAWPDDSVSVRFWPPRLTAGIGCEADCATVDGFSAQIDRWSGFAARTETGLGTARTAGFRRRPVMVSGWII